MLDQDAGEALERPEHGAVDHHRHGLLAVRPDIEGAEPHRHVEIDLDRAALPVAADGVAQHVFELRSVERAFAWTELVLQAGRLDRAFQRGFGLVPHLVRADALVRPVGELDAHVLKAEVAIDRQHLLVELHAFLGDLILGAEDMRVVLGEVAHAQEPVQRP